MLRSQISSATLSMVALIVMLFAAFATETSWAASTVESVSTSIPTQRDAVQIAQTLRQKGDVSGPTCTSTDKSESCACEDGQLCLGYANNCKCIGTPTGSSNDTNPTGSKRTN